MAQVIRLKPEPPAEEWKARKMTLKITDRQQLWNVCVKSPNARCAAALPGALTH